MRIFLLLIIEKMHSFVYHSMLNSWGLSESEQSPELLVVQFASSVIISAIIVTPTFFSCMLLGLYLRRHHSEAIGVACTTLGSFGGCVFRVVSFPFRTVVSAFRALI